MAEPLYRQEVLRRQGERLWGDLLLAQPLSFTLLTVFLAALVVLALGFLARQDYLRKQAVSGVLVPDQGLLDIRAPQGGLLAAVAVVPDQSVAAGAPLFTLQLDHTLAGGRGLTAGLLDEVAQQQQALQQQVSDHRAAMAMERRRLEERQDFLVARLAELQRLAGNARAQLDLQRQAAARAAQLWQQGLLAAADHDLARARLLQQQAAVLELALQQTDTRAERDALRTEAAAGELAGRQQLRELEAELAELEKQKLRLGAEQYTTVVAPMAGRVTTLLRQRGMTVATQEPVLALLPAGSELQAELLLPSSAIGFVAPGQRVTLRYAAFPYQKFGVQHASVASVAGSAETAHEGAGAQAVYRVSARLERQHITAYGRELPLRPGMLLSADIELDRRSLLEWLLEPLYSLRGRR